MSDYRVMLTSGVPLILRNGFIAGNGIAGDLADGSTYWISDDEYTSVEAL